MSLTPDRVYSQYRKDPATVAWYGITSAMAQPLADVCERVRTSYDVDAATPYELDVLERIVVVRTRVNPTSIPVGLDLTAVRKALIKATIVRNTSSTDSDSILSALQYITGVNDLVINDREDMSFDVIFLTTLPAEITYILNTYNIVPRGQGVKFRGFADATGYTQFGDDNQQFGGDESQFSYLFGGS